MLKNFVAPSYKLVLAKFARAVSVLVRRHLGGRLATTLVSPFLIEGVLGSKNLFSKS